MKLRLSNLRFGSSGCVGVCAVGPADKQHPNKMPFKGTLLILDQASDKPPHGAEGHRIYVPSAVASRRLSTLLNMGMNYEADLAGHAPRHKVGVMTGARIDGKKVLVNGFLWARDFPEVKRDLHAGRLGMSMELQDVSVRDKNAPVWYLEDFHFSGATILLKNAAAYTQTSLSAGAIKELGERWGKRVRIEIKRIAGKTALAAAAASVRKSEGGRMGKEKKKETASNGQGELLVQAIAAGVAPAISTAIREALGPFVTVLDRQRRSIARIAASVEESKVLAIEAAKRGEEEEEEEEMDAAGKKRGEEEEEEMDAAKRGEEEEEEEEEMDAAGKKKKDEDDDDDDEEDDAELDAEMEKLEDDHAREEPGQVNEDTENRGDKTTLLRKVGKAKSMKELVKASSARSISASSVIRELYAAHRATRKKFRTFRASANEKIENLTNQLEAMQAQVEQFAERQDRKSISAELGNFLAKNNVDVRELRANGQKMSVEQVDQIFANAPIELDPTTRMWFKNQLTQAELMEQGEIHRGF